MWRRTTLDEYRKPAPHWETVLDLDALAARRGRELGLGRRRPASSPHCERCLVSLSRGGGDAARGARIRPRARWPSSPDGFTLPEAKSERRLDRPRHLFVATDFGPGSMTELRLSAHRQGMAARHAAGRRDDRVRSASSDDLSASAWHDYDARLRAPVRAAPDRLLHAASCSCATDGRRADAGRQAGRRRRLHGARPAADRAALGLDGRRHAPTRRARCWRSASTRFLARRARLRVAVRARADARRWTASTVTRDAHPADRARQRQEPHRRAAPRATAPGSGARSRLPASARWACPRVDDVRSRRLLPDRDRLPDARARSYLAHAGSDRARAAEVDARVLRRQPACASQQFEATSTDGTARPLLRRDARRTRRCDGSQSDAAVRLRRLRGLADARLQRRDRRGLAGARRRLRAGQHPRRRRVRPALAPGGAEGTAPDAPSTTSSPSPRT